MGNRIYGCDDCLAVCPWNRFAQRSRQAKLRARPELTAPRLAELAALDDAGFRALFSGSPVKRIGRDRFARNVAIAIGNSADPALAAVRTASGRRRGPGGGRGRRLGGRAPGLMLEKRSVTLAGHRTSVALEPEFWAALETLAASAAADACRVGGGGGCRARCRAVRLPRRCGSSHFLRAVNLSESRRLPCCDRATRGP